ncbi:MAG: flagellar basal body rod protein FlgB [Gammaproteobacteria bacterium]|nr:flagellar basal body rod protein FlgB [Gammaproteobacteria bacterium]MDH5800523.1 flagellar basal body rod protein FlgB [Gammaproteobacteria bacterium]
MRFDIDSYLGVHATAVTTRSKRAEILANNLANADTPGFKARDFDFKQAMQQAMTDTGISSGMKTTHAKHIRTSDSINGAELMYRSPMQPSVDGNTVDSQVEKSQFLQNALQYQASLMFLSGKIKTLKTALKGE